MLNVSVFDPWHRSVAVFGATPRTLRLLLRCNSYVWPPALWLALGLVPSARAGNMASSCGLWNPIPLFLEAPTWEFVIVPILPSYVL